ncbi:TIGR03364 family FAD-dependent oxidoreductase [Novosphingobium terrae]|uniref:TIGR03364 family FAD-dependent oxidoreductase n=1 Tax=Novosphingobium terrae TaxID=2726189 RepID=UPI00197E3110|nr:TIGR03364 family FAD-dependent oxidoreductase [Novosphingobium terrae]
MTQTYDLAVVGGGILGLAHAYVAAREGLKVVLIERDGAASGASIRNFGFITVTGQERGTSWQLARRTRDIWADLAPRAAIPVEHEGLYLTARSPEAIAVIEAFLKTEMGEGCSLMDAAAFRAASGGMGGTDLLGALHSPHEIRVESRFAIPRITAFLAEQMGVTVMTKTAVHEIAPPRLATSRGVVEAGQVVVCPGDDFSTLYPERIAAYGLTRCRLSMLRLAAPGRVRLPGAIMSDLGLVRYRGYGALPEARALEARLRAEVPRLFDNGVHLIVAQGTDGSLIVGDSHHYADVPPPFAPASAEEDILQEYATALGGPVPPVIERWTGTYAVAADRTFLIDTPAENVRLVIVTSGTGASTGFGIAEKVLADLAGLHVGVTA